MFELRLRQNSTVPLELQGILPDTVAGMSTVVLSKRIVHHGNRKIELGEFFDIQTFTTTEPTLRFLGDCSHVHGIGRGMTTGQIIIDGEAGRHAGAQMRGGSLEIIGNAGDHLGAELHGGLIRLHGNAADSVGSAYIGSRQGMTGGTIVIAGNAGNGVAERMRRGLIAVCGTVGDDAASAMIAGTLVALDGVGARCGNRLKRGTIVTQSLPAALHPGFHYCCDFTPAWAGVLQNHLKSLGILLAINRVHSYHGDTATGGIGELWVCDQT